VGPASSGSERRRWQRLPLPVPVFIRGVDERGQEFLEFTTSLNISAGGALLATRRFLPYASKVSLEIPPPPFPKPKFAGLLVRNLKAKVVQVRNSERCHLLGLAFYRPMATH
jgi:hypothetical protein